MPSQSLETALEAVAEAAKLARQAQKVAEQEAVESRAQAADWERRYRQERERALDLRSQLRRGALQLPRRHSSLPPQSRRNTAPPPNAAQQAQHAQHDVTPFRAPLVSSGSDASSAATSSIGLAALSSALAACLLLQTGASHPRISSEAQRAPSPHEEDTAEHSTVSVADDGGAGVGTAAAAAVSVALAQSWAAVAGAGPRAPPVSDAPSAAGPLGKSRFKLVAAVPRNLDRRSLTAGPTASPGGQNHTPRGASPSPGLPPPPRNSSEAASEENGIGTGGNGGSAASTLPSEARALSTDPGLALESIDDAQALDDTQEATWRASGSHLKLHWLSAPSGVLVIFKPVAEVLEAAATAVPWLLRRGIVVYVEPKAHADVRRAAAEVLRSEKASAGLDMHRSGSTGSSLFGAEEPLSEACEAAAALSEAARVARASPYVDQLLDQLLLTWPAPGACECSDVVPPDVARRLDLVLTLGGDGTVLWACSLFGNGSVPPVVAMAMGSLGFMTPFPLSRMESVLGRVTSVAHGFPLMLRHRLQCRILRAGASAADLSAFNPCTDDALVLNEVVIDRGMTSTLAVLQCYVDKNFVTTIQGDGLIVSTPTGSTAYNLAAGGSMVHPSVPCILFTPICAHTLSSRPLVFPEHVTLRVKVPADSRGGAYCSFDGRGRELLHPGDSVLIHVSQWPVPMVCNLDSSHDWFLSVREGLNWNRRVPQKGR